MPPFIFCYADCHYANCRYANCRYDNCRYADFLYADCLYAECSYAECRYAECHHAECHGAIIRIMIDKLNTPLTLGKLMDDEGTQTQPHCFKGLSYYLDQVNQIMIYSTHN